jgi:hypothetical protein
MASAEELELLNAELDDALDEHQRARLSRALLADPELRTRRAELSQLAAALESVAEAEPPAGFSRGVLAALPQSFPKTASSWWASPAWRRAAVIASVLAAGAIVSAVVGGHGPSTTELAGTLAGTRSAAVLDTVQLADGPVRGRASLTRGAAGLGIELELTAGAPLQVLVTRAGRILGSVDVGPATAEPVAVSLPGAIADGTAVELSFRAAGREIGRATLRAPAGP